MKILPGFSTHNVLYKYRGQVYETLPIRNYYIEMEEIVGTVKYISVRRKIPMYIHVLILLMLVVPLIIINYSNSQEDTVQVRNHTLRIPSEMYYDYTTKILDIDITNDNSNFETISLTIKSPKGDTIIQLNGINPGESIGSLPVDFEFESLPVKGTITYKSMYNNYVFKDIEKDVLIVDRVVADRDVNRDF
jgi:hypothetical protein